MKVLCKSLLLAAIVGLAATSCKKEDPYQAGFNFSYASTGVYANTTSDSLVFVAYGPWKITPETAGASWVQLQTLSGRGNSINKVMVNFQPNTSGASRTARFSIVDTDHPDDAHAAWAYTQTATRGDGSLGNAALVKTITSSDGYEATIDYDAKARPVKYVQKAPSGSSTQLNISYNDGAGVLTVSDGTNTVRGSMDIGYQAAELIGDRDTLGYRSQYYSQYAYTADMTHAFNFVSYRQNGYQLYGILLGGQPLAADSLHCADSLRYINRTRMGSYLCNEALGLKYGAMDNRHQSVDVNQLLLGFDECHPMLLLSMFRYVRSTSILTAASSARRDISVVTQLNADKSVSTMTISDAKRGTQVTYTFGY